MIDNPMHSIPSETEEVEKIPLLIVKFVRSKDCNQLSISIQQATDQLMQDNALLFIDFQVILSLVFYSGFDSCLVVILTYDSTFELSRLVVRWHKEYLIY